MQHLSTFNKLYIMNSVQNRKILLEYIRILLYDDYLTEKKIPNSHGSFLTLNNKSLDWLNKYSPKIESSFNILNYFFKKIRHKFCKIENKGCIISSNTNDIDINIPIKGNKKYIDLLINNYSINSMADKLKFSRRTIENNICKLLNDNPELRLDWNKIEGPTNEIISLIIKASNSWNGKLLRELKDLLPESISYYDINLTLTPQGKFIHESISK